MSFYSSIPLDRVTGLRPESWICVGAGFSREEVKNLIFSQKSGFIAEAMTTLPEVCLKIIGGNKTQILSSSARQEVLRVLLSEPRIMREMNELKRLKRQRNFIRKLDLSFQAARMTFAHSQEEEVLNERLNQAMGHSQLRVELKALSQAFETWCEATACMDLPMLISKATEVLKKNWPEGLSRPKEFIYLCVESPESLEKEFWETLAQHVEIRMIQTFQSAREQMLSLEWRKWHTLDDAAESFADQLVTQVDSSNWNQIAVLIPDIPTIRRSLRRALEQRNIPLADPRDPTRMRWDELVKWAMLPLDVVGRNFERQRVISWLREHQMQDDFASWIQEINVRGIRNGIKSYTGGMLEGVHSRLNELYQSFGGRKTCEEIAESHLKLLRSQLGIDSGRLWIVSFFESLWEQFQSDIKKTGQESKKAPLFFWLERLQSRLSEASPPVDPLKPKVGLQLYRLQQAPLIPVQQVWIFGLPPSWLSGDGTGDYWYSERAREILALEFAIRGPKQVRDERVQILKSWLEVTQEAFVLDAHYDYDGRERESILPVLKELELALNGKLALNSAVDCGAHPRFIKSYQVQRPVQPQKIQLPSLKSKWNKNIDLTATAIDRYSRCPMQALAYHRWNLRDSREPNTELWPDAKGNILHEAVRVLVSQMDAEGNFKILPQEALELAWNSKRPKGLFRAARVENYAKSRLLAILEAFCEKEREYIKRSGASPLSLDDLHLRLDYENFTIIGQPDRVDRFQDGLFVIDYKSSGTVPHGSEMMEQGYRLQLPFYALALKRKLKLPVKGAQFVELDKKGARKSGIFFKEFNGKGPGTLTQARSNSKSLISKDIDEVWNLFEEHLIKDAESLIQGHFEAMPKTSKPQQECQNCHVSDFCGFRRKVEASDEDET